MLQLFSGEIVIREASNGEIVLTTHRLVEQIKDLGTFSYQSIFLKHVTACENVYKSHPWMLLIAGILALLGCNGLAGRSSEAGALFIVLALILIGILVVSSKCCDDQFAQL